MTPGMYTGTVPYSIWWKYAGTEGVKETASPTGNCDFIMQLIIGHHTVIWIELNISSQVISKTDAWQFSSQDLLEQR